MKLTSLRSSVRPREGSQTLLQQSRSSRDRAEVQLALDGHVSFPVAAVPISKSVGLHHVPLHRVGAGDFVPAVGLRLDHRLRAGAGPARPCHRRGPALERAEAPLRPASIASASSPRSEFDERAAAVDPEALAVAAPGVGHAVGVGEQRLPGRARRRGSSQLTSAKAAEQRTVLAELLDAARRHAQRQRMPADGQREPVALQAQAQRGAHRQRGRFLSVASTNASSAAGLDSNSDALRIVWRTSAVSAAASIALAGDVADQQHPLSSTSQTS